MGLFGRRRNGFDRQENPAPTDNYLNLTKYDEKFIFPTDGGNTAPQGMENVQPSELGAATVTAVRDLSAAEQPSAEKPMVFLSRAHSDIYIYEYSDRLEYYVKTATCMYKLNTVKK